MIWGPAGARSPAPGASPPPGPGSRACAGQRGAARLLGGWHVFRACWLATAAEFSKISQRPHRLVARTSRCGCDNPGSNPGVDRLLPVLQWMGFVWTPVCRSSPRVASHEPANRSLSVCSLCKALSLVHAVACVPVPNALTCSLARPPAASQRMHACVARSFNAHRRN